jgi:RNA polymerase sigma factor (sigma-70 family)
MAADSPSVVEVQQCLNRLRAGDTAALDALIDRANSRLLRLTQKMLADDFRRLQRWEAADDVYQNAVLRLCRTLRETVPESPREFFRLAALQVRRELLDLARHYYGPLGVGENHASVAADAASTSAPGPGEAVGASTHDPGQLARWTDFHRLAGELPEAEREVFDLLWYQDMPQDEAAALLGVDVRTIQRRWRSARLSLAAALKSDAGL